MVPVHHLRGWLRIALCVMLLCTAIPASAMNIGFFWEYEDFPIADWDFNAHGVLPASTPDGVTKARCGSLDQLTSRISDVLWEGRCIIRGQVVVDFGIAAKCPSGYTGTRSPVASCTPNGQPIFDKTNGRPKVCVGDPIDPVSSNQFEADTDYTGTGPFPFVLRRSYNGRINGGKSNWGLVWQGKYDAYLDLEDAGPIKTVLARRSDGKTLPFSFDGTQWISDADVSDRLEESKDANGVRTGWKYFNAESEEVEQYDAAGRLASISSREGLTHQLVYSDGSALPPNGGVIEGTSSPIPPGLLIRVIDAFGRAISFGRDASGHIVRVTDPAGSNIVFGYDSAGRLVSVTYPDGGIRRYIYNEPANTAGANLPRQLTGIQDENGDRFATLKYDAQSRALGSEQPNGVSRTTLVYGNSSTTVTDALGTSRVFGSRVVLGVVKNTTRSQPAGAGCGPSASAMTYDANGNVATRTDFNGNRTDYSYDLTRNLETRRIEGLSSAGAMTAQTRTISTEWHAAFRLPVKVAEPLRITSYVYNGDGGSSCGSRPDGSLVPGVLCSKTLQATNDATGAQGLSATPLASSRTWRYTYNENGSVLTIDGPRTDVSDVTAYTYYANDDSDPGKRGNVATITNALGQVTSITAYNADGQPLTIVDPNGLTTTLTYDARMRLTSRNVGGELTSYGYDAVGQLTRVTLPDGSFLAYTYDPAHRLTGIADSAGNRIAYTLDAMGNRLKEEVFDPNGVLAQTRSRVFDALSRLASDIGAQNQTTSYGYDPNGNLTSVVDPLNRPTTNAYDALNHLVRVTDPANGVTGYGYDGADRLTSVTDPRSLTTSYSYDGLANLLVQQSPDTGTTSNTYDESGNLLTQTDAKGQVTTYAYDALNRVTLIAFQDGSKQSYVYDQGVNGLGRLGSITETDPAAQVTSQVAYGYDPHGRVTSEARSIAGVQYVTGYAYDASGRLIGMTYPDGRTVAYTLDPLGRIAQIDTTKDDQTQTVVSAVAYQPFGGVKSYTLGNGHVYTRSYDQDGRIASYTLGGRTFAIGYDAASRIEFISDTAVPANSNNYGYDALDRLTSAVTPSTSYSYGYDAVGNRLSKTAGAGTDTYAYSTSSNRIASITPASGPIRSFVFDPNGSTTDDGHNTYAYDTRGRMVQATSSVGTTTYQVNALGQRVRKTNSSGDTVFHYDTRGHLIAESDPGGAVKREYIYLGDIPVGVLQ